MSANVKVGGTWQTLDTLWVKVSGSWQQVETAWVKVSGTWQKVYDFFTWTAVNESKSDTAASAPTVGIRYNTDGTVTRTSSAEADQAGTDISAPADSGQDIHVRFNEVSNTGGTWGGQAFGAWVILQGSGEASRTKTFVLGSGADDTGVYDVLFSLDGGTTTHHSVQNTLFSGDLS